MEERRRENDKNWDEIKNFIKDQTSFNNESREYRAADIVKQEYIMAQVKKTNGRVDEIEDWIKEAKVRIQDKKDSRINAQALITIIATVIMAVSAAVMLLKK